MRGLLIGVLTASLVVCPALARGNPLLEAAGQGGVTSFKSFLYTSNGACPGTWTGPGTTTVARSGNNSNVDCAGTLTAINANLPRVEVAGLLVENGITERFLNNCTAPATQAMAVGISSSNYAWIEGTGSLLLENSSATVTGLPCTVTASSPCAFVVTGAGSIVGTISGDVTFASVATGTLYKTSKFCIAGTQAARYVDTVTQTNHLASGKPWCFTAKAKPRGDWSVGASRGIYGIGPTNAAANSASMFISGTTPTCTIYDAATGNRYHNALAAHTAGVSAEIWTCCQNTALSYPTLYIDGAPASNTPAGAGAGIITTMPATNRIGYNFGSSFGGNFEWVMQCTGSNDPARCGQSAMKIRVDCLGDSITAGGTTPYCTTMGATLGSGYATYNRGVNGDRTNNCITRWQTSAKSASVGVRRLTILIGINDINNGVTAIAAYANIATILSEAAADGVTKIAIGTVMPYVTLDAPKRTELNSLNALIAATPGVTVVDTWAAMKDPGDPTALNPAYDSGDHLHPNDDGRLAIAALFAAAIQ